MYTVVYHRNSMYTPSPRLTTCTCTMQHACSHATYTQHAPNIHTSYMQHTRQTRYIPASSAIATYINIQVPYTHQHAAYTIHLQHTCSIHAVFIRNTRMLPAHCKPCVECDTSTHHASTPQRTRIMHHTRTHHTHTCTMCARAMHMCTMNVPRMHAPCHAHLTCTPTHARATDGVHIKNRTLVVHHPSPGLVGIESFETTPCILTSCMF